MLKEEGYTTLRPNIFIKIAHATNRNFYQVMWLLFGNWKSHLISHIIWFNIILPCDLYINLASDLQNKLFSNIAKKLKLQESSHLEITTGVVFKEFSLLSVEDWDAVTASWTMSKA